MADVPDPNKPAAPPQPPGPEPLCALLALCVECGDGFELILPLDQHALSIALAQRGWFISVLSPPPSQPGQPPPSPMVLGPLCTACAQKVYPPEVFAAAEQRRQQLLQFAAQAAQTAQAPR